MNYYIFRHGETYFSKTNTPYGNQIETAEILPEAIPVIERLATFLKETKTDANISSTFKRCVQTTEIVKKITQKEFVYDSQISDFNRSKETISELITRIKKFYDEILSKNYQNVAICTHGYPINVFRKLILNQNVESEEDLLGYPKTGVLVTIKEGKEKIIDFN